MNPVYIIVIVVVVLLAAGIAMGAVFSRRQRAKRYEKKYGADYDATVKTMGDEKKAQTEMDSRMEHVGTLNIRPLTMGEREGYLANWKAVQTKFIDEPAQATVEASHLITKVMQTRNYPISDFEQRAADVSINYPDLVTNYRAAREIAVKNERHEASTEELRKALVYYRSLFDELLAPEAVVENK
jgi:hypothetical protein